jgi:ABC-type transporter Mla subunit MlaD
LVGSRVDFQGIHVGRVTNVRFVGGRTEVLITVDPDLAPIQGGTAARLDRTFVTGQATIELFGYAEGDVALAEDSVIEATPSMGAVMVEALPDLLRAARGTLDELTMSSLAFRQVLSPDNAERMAATVGATHALVTELRAVVNGVGQATEAVSATVAESRRALQRNLQELAVALHEIHGLARDLRTSPSSLMWGRALRERQIPDAGFSDATGRQP